MIRSMRKGVSSLWVRVMLVLVGLSMVSFYGFQGAGGQFKPGIAAKVNGEEIRTKEVQQRVQMTLNFYREQGLLQEEYLSMLAPRLQGDVLKSLIQERLGAAEAAKIGWSVPKNQLKNTIQKQFSSDEQEFDFELYKNILERRLGKSPAQFEKEVGRQLLAQEFQGLLEKTSSVPSQEVKMRYESNNSQAELEFIRLTPETIGKKLNVAAPTSDEMNAYLKDHPEKYSIAEKRKLEIFWDDISKYLEKPSNIQLRKTLRKKFGNRDQKKEGKQVRYRAAHILIKSPKSLPKDRKKIQKIYQRVTSGKEDFAAIARVESQDTSSRQGGDLGYFGPGKMVKEFEDAVKKLSVGGISKPVKSQFGYHIIKLLDVIDEGELTVGRLTNELAYEWKKEALRAEKEKTRLFEKSIESFMSAKTDEERKAKFNFLETAPLELTGQIANIPNLSDSSLILNVAKSQNATELGKVIRSISSPYSYWVRVKEIIPQQTMSFDQARSRIKVDMMAERSLEKFEQETKELEDFLQNEKTSLSQIAKKYQLKVEKTPMFKPSPKNEIPTIGSSQIAMFQTFEKSEGEMLDPIKLGLQEVILAQVSKKIQPDWTQFEDKKDVLTGSVKNQAKSKRYQLWMENLEKQSDISKPEQANN